MPQGDFNYSRPPTNEEFIEQARIAWVKMWRDISFLRNASQRIEWINFDVFLKDMLKNGPGLPVRPGQRLVRMPGLQQIRASSMIWEDKRKGQRV